MRVFGQVEKRSSLSLTQQLEGQSIELSVTSLSISSSLTSCYFHPCRTLEDQKNETTPWASRLDGSPPINLLQRSYRSFHRSRPFEPEPENDDDVEEDDGTTVNEPFHFDFDSGEKNLIVTRSSVTVVSDIPTYELTAFKKKMNTLKNREVSRKALFRNLPRFETDGSFSSLFALLSRGA